MNFNKKCFVISPIGEQDSDTRKRSDIVLKHIIKPITLKCGYETLRADEMAQPGLITTQIIEHLLNDDIVIADLTENNANVFYELAIRHVIKKPYIHLISVGHKIPFDIVATRTIYYNHRDFDQADKTKEELEKQIRFVEQNPQKIDSPISYSLDLTTLKESSNPGDKDLGSLINLVQNLQLEFSNFSENIFSEMKEIKSTMGKTDNIDISKQLKDLSKFDKIQETLKSKK